MSEKRPNILWIVTDEQRADSLRCYGNPWAHSPNIDRLAQRGVLYRNAFCQSPVCVSSRATMLTGKYGHVCDVLENWYHLNITSWHRAHIADAMEKLGPNGYQRRCDELSGKFPDLFKSQFTHEVPVWYHKSIGRALAQIVLAQELGLIDKGPRHKMVPEILAEHGYHTVAIGKLHHGGVHTGFQDVPPVPEYEYAYFFGLRKQYDPKQFHLVQHPEFSIIFGGTCPVPASQTFTAKWTDIAIDWMKAKVREPFLLHVSIHDPHTPVLPPEPYDRMFDPKDMPMPHPTMAELMAMSRHDQSQDLPVFRNRLNETQQRHAWASYYGLTAFVDHEIGRLLDALAASPYADNTIVVFNSDHGTLLGEHDLYQKEVFFEEATHVPLILSWPGNLPEGETVDSLVQLIDIAPTLFDLTGLDTPADMDGESLSELVFGMEPEAHEAVFSELHIGEPDTAWLRGERLGTIRRTIRADEWRLTVNYPEDPFCGPDGALYNITEDPAERHNLYCEKKYRKIAQALHQQLVDWVES